MVAYGIATKEQNEVRTGRLLRKSQSVVGLWITHVVEQRPERYREALEDCFARAARGELRVVVGKTYPLSEARQAQEDLAGRRTTGKLLLDAGVRPASAHRRPSRAMLGLTPHARRAGAPRRRGARAGCASGRRACGRCG